MSDTEYTKVYGGNIFLVTRVKVELEAIGIVPIIKDESESFRLNGYPIINDGFQEVYVNNEELEKAMEVVNRVKSEMEA
ncbi:putative signal transducing protein [uncultured Winogradskyella sp.]|uniref:putative signal transducing protein n=1 Tax=uncultured Winogradskyella sp. TaxID=395353 RepID=UPI0026379A7B|nr:DUF2007 domain-containing protein [uncultured Winogradskyella sp.]